MPPLLLFTDPQGMPDRMLCSILYNYLANVILRLLDDHFIRYIFSHLYIT